MNVADDADNPTRRTGSFVNFQDALEDDEKCELILRCAIRELHEIQNKYNQLQEWQMFLRQLILWASV